MSALTPADVVKTFSDETGIRFRFIPHGIQRQAAAFVQHGFQLDELRLVVAWTKRQITRGQGGYSTASLQWRVIFGDLGAADEFMKFQERLGLAEEAKRRGWRYRPTGSPQPASPKPAEPKLVETPAFDPSTVTAAADDFFAKMGFRPKPAR